MKTFAHFTAIIFIVLGILIILGGLAFAFSTAFIQTPKSSTPSIIPDLSGMLILARLIGGGAISLQGLFLAAIGQVLWLLAGIFDHTEETNELLADLMRRNNQARNRSDPA